MFWRFNEPWQYLDTEPGHHEAQCEALSQRLFGLTFWGDYAGDTLSRFHYSVVLESFPTAVTSINAAHGQGLVLSSVTDSAALRGVIEFLAYFDPKAKGFCDYPIYEELGDYSEWEWELTHKEMTEGWWAEYSHGELVDALSEWEDNTLVPDHDTPEWGELVYTYCSRNDWDDVETYWEGADSLIVHGWESDEVAKWLLEQYADTFVPRGNVEPF
jgi:hypothetical protein